MTDIVFHWVKIAEQPHLLSFNAEHIAVVQIADRTFCVARYKEQLFGFAYRCPHAAVPLSEGYIDTHGNIVCPLHAYKFSLLNGRNVSGEGYFLKTWPVECRPDGVFLGIPPAPDKDPKTTHPCQ
ncbi:MAG: Rieske (2Fe-2S) protein [Sphingomonadales bacterium]